MMKKISAVILALLFFMLCGVTPAYAALDSAEEADKYLDTSGFEELLDNAPSASREQLVDQGMEKISDASGLTVSGLWETITHEVTNSLRQPLKILCSLIGIILVCVLLQSVGSSLSQSNVHQVFQIIVSVFIVTILLNPIIECTMEIGTSIDEFSIFLTTYVPAFAGVIPSAGQPMTAAAYNILLFGICQVIGQLLKNFFVPLVSCYLALAVVSEICPQMGLHQMIAGIKSFITWALGLSMTIFFGLLTIQSVVASSGDNIAVKTTKFFISSFIPAVGGTLSDLFVATQGCMQLLKSTVGVFGIVIALFTFLPVLIKTAMWYITVQIGGLIGGIFGITEINRLLKSIASALGIVLAIILYYSLLFIISTTLMIVAFKGG